MSSTIYTAQKKCLHFGLEPRASNGKKKYMAGKGAKFSVENNLSLYDSGLWCLRYGCLNIDGSHNPPVPTRKV